MTAPPPEEARGVTAHDDVTALVNILATAEGEEPQPWMAHYAEAILASEWFATRTSLERRR